MPEVHLSFEEFQAAARNLAEQRRAAREDFVKRSEEAAEADSEYQKSLAIAYAQYRAGEKGHGEAELLAKGDVADKRKTRDIAESLRKAALLKVDEIERKQSTLRQLADFSRELEGVG